MALAAFVKQRLSSLLNRDTYITLGAITVLVGTTTVGLVAVQSIQAEEQRPSREEDINIFFRQVTSALVNRYDREEIPNLSKEELAPIIRRQLPSWIECSIISEESSYLALPNRSDINCEQLGLELNTVENNSQDSRNLILDYRGNKYIVFSDPFDGFNWKLNIIIRNNIYKSVSTPLRLIAITINSLSTIAAISIAKLFKQQQLTQKLKQVSQKQDETISSLRRSDLDRVHQQTEFMQKAASTLDRLAEGPVRTLYIWILQQVEQYQTPATTPNSLQNAYSAATSVVEQLDKVRLTQQLNTIEANRVLPGFERNAYPQNIDRLCRDLVESYGYDVQLTFRGICDLVSTDAYLIDRCLKELIENAVIYSSPHPETEGVQIEVDCEANDALIFYVRDRGIGIPPEDLPFVTQLFVRGSNLIGEDINLAQARIGAGLYIASQAVKVLGGQLTIANRRNGGVEVEVRLPRNSTSTQS